MKFKLKIKDIKSIYEIDGYWKDSDYINILEELEFEDARKSNPSELRELVEMALSDYEPHESARCLLLYKLKNTLTPGQINNLSHEMTTDNEAEENANMALHYTLFNINELLRSSYKGTFPNTKATRIIFELSFTDDPKVKVTKELALKSICKGLSENSPLNRLFEKQLNGQEPFDDVEDVIWEISHRDNDDFEIITSDYWINNEDIDEYEISGSIKQFELKERKPEKKI